MLLFCSGASKYLIAQLAALATAHVVPVSACAGVVVSTGDEDCCCANGDAAGLDLLWQCTSTQGKLNAHFSMRASLSAAAGRLRCANRTSSRWQQQQQQQH
jgi:hypothetical protein